MQPVKPETTRLVRKIGTRRKQGRDFMWVNGVRRRILRVVQLEQSVSAGLDLHHALDRL